jgi:protein SCO1/2
MKILPSRVHTNKMLPRCRRLKPHARSSQDYHEAVREIAKECIVRVRAVSLFVVLVAGCMFAISGCRNKTGSTAAAADDSASSKYPVHGKVVGVDATTNSIDLDAADIPGLMEAMTMTYKVTDPAAIGEMHAGDTISATLLVDHDAAGLKNMRLKDVVIVAEGSPDHKPTVQYHIPAAGEAVPDFKLLNQSNRTIDLKTFRGKVVAMTFIYTRCPLADYCPRMSRNFAEIDKALATDKNLYAKTHLISVSFDPTYDTPKVLKSYGEAYTGKFINETFQHWDFTAPPAAELPKMEQYFDVGVTPGEAGQLQHSLSTIVIGKDGKVVAFWPTNDWTVADVLAKIKAAS